MCNHDNGQSLLGLPLNALVGLAMAMSALSGGLGLAMQIPEPGRYAAMTGSCLVALVGLLMIRGSNGYSRLFGSMRAHPLPWIGVAILFLVAMRVVLGTMDILNSFVG